MRFKRDNELIEKIDLIIDEADNLTSEQREAIKNLKHCYERTTYKDWDDRHKFYQDTVEDMVNDTGFMSDDLADKMVNTHPTLQSNFMRMCVRFVKGMANKPYYDDRNHTAGEVAKAMCKGLEEIKVVYIPHI